MRCRLTGQGGEGGRVGGEDLSQGLGSGHANNGGEWGENVLELHYGGLLGIVRTSVNYLKKKKKRRDAED